MTTVMLRAGHAIVIAVIALLTLGIVMVTSAGLAVGSARPVTLESILTGRSVIYALLALASMAVASTFDPQWITNWHERLGRWFNGRWRYVFSPVTLLGAIMVAALGMVYVSGIGKEVNGARRWVRIGPAGWDLSFQPSELAKWAMVIIIATWVVTVGPDRVRKFFKGLVPALLVVMLVCGLIVLEDLGTAVLIGMVAIIILYAGGAKLWHIGILFPAPVLAIVAAIATSPYRLARIRSFINPYADPQGEGYHMIQSMATVAKGGLTGRGLGHGVNKFGYLPEDTTDFLFAVICEELGLLGALLVVFLYGVILLAAWRIIRNQASRLSQLIGLGVIATVSLQALINLMVVTGLAPTKGIALPLLSSGGTGWILTAASLGLLVGMDRRAGAAQRSAEIREEQADEKCEALPTVNVLSISAARSSETGDDESKAAHGVVAVST